MYEHCVNRYLFSFIASLFSYYKYGLKIFDIGKGFSFSSFVSFASMLLLRLFPPFFIACVFLFRCYTFLCLVTVVTIDFEPLKLILRPFSHCALRHSGQACTKSLDGTAVSHFRVYRQSYRCFGSQTVLCDDRGPSVLETTHFYWKRPFSNMWIIRQSPLKALLLLKSLKISTAWSHMTQNIEILPTWFYLRRIENSSRRPCRNLDRNSWIAMRSQLRLCLTLLRWTSSVLTRKSR